MTGGQINLAELERRLNASEHSACMTDWERDEVFALVEAVEAAQAYRDDFVLRGRNDEGLAMKRGALFQKLARFSFGDKA